jgi:hypothetical protein
LFITPSPCGLVDRQYHYYSQQPFLRALLLPLGSYGGSALLEYLTMASF